MNSQTTTPQPTSNISFRTFVFHGGRLALIAVFVLSLVAALHPNVRSSMRNTLLKEYRTIVSTVSGDLRGNGSNFTVIKVKTREGLSLEIYETLSDGNNRLIKRLEMADNKDGFFKFRGKSTNLAIDDIDGDGKPEIISPSFDQNLVGHLSVFHYDEVAQDFTRVSL